MAQVRNAKYGLMSDSRFDTGDVLAIPRGGKRHVVLEVQRPDWEWLKGAFLFRRLCKIPAGCPPWPDEVYEHDAVIVIGKITDSDIGEKLKRYGVKLDNRPASALNQADDDNDHHNK